MAMLSGSHFHIIIYRQSGNVHTDYDVTGDAAEAIKKTISTFRRAKINAVNIRQNTLTTFSISRMYHDHHGRAEGKKVGSATIIALS